MSDGPDPERLLAEALRAQARSAPPTDRAPSVPPQYGLLSGVGGEALERERAALEPPTVRHPAIRPKLPAGPLPAYWVLLLAALLGLATGAVIGLMTLF
ncbi:hypothetical protein FHX82_000034 [Amycolatopsis bartoniae]|uniref:Uncharacterized protein n=1 Tax=Amycolatopsis bartoniae TaxID=941986 RepID=A0A8H9IS78_9PSEU|nr:hypothetical protein [Amycolatopsis bartoniae]MBB2933014.1 hypothetical protein [Amycolatopsis bartoniae]TVT03390.1 hypothetical protein FNH07_25580 [Amycolatopsis bartoniae]GHF56390.1 hypothetical protein GCM10017566_31940 [Amycolatopsis bartoniae]